MIQFDLIRAHDPELCGYMEEELARKRSLLAHLASESLVSATVMAALGIHLTKNMRKATPESVTTAVVNALTRLKILPVIVSKSSLVRNMQMSSPIPAHRRTFPFILRFLTPAIRFSA